MAKLYQKSVLLSSTLLILNSLLVLTQLVKRNKLSVSVYYYVGTGMGTTYYPKTRRVDKLSKEEVSDLTFDLINAFGFVQTPLETAFLIRDLLTASEIRQLAIRLRIAKLLLNGNFTQRDIAKKLRCSLATVTKVNIWLNQGGEGLRKIVTKLPKRYEMPKNLPHGPIEYHLPELLIGITQYALVKHQKGQLEQFAENVEGKRVLDKNLQEDFDEEFRILKSNKKKKL